jgi:hydroxyethylthiazole kinase-like uncharacterized protein yjeF
MKALYSLKEIRAIEHAASARLPAGTLMQRAGLSAAEIALTLLPRAPAECKVLVLAGPGNNGGDALETAARLSRSGAHVSVLLFADPARQSPDAQQAFLLAQNSGAHFADIARAGDLLTESPKSSEAWSLIIDGLFGIGLTRAISGALHDLVAQLNRVDCPVLALDIPSGLDADTGNVVGHPGIAVRATHTISFIADKPGLHTADGRDYAGEISIAALDIDPLLFPLPRAQLSEVPLFAGTLRRRLQNSHKGSNGDVAIVGGAHGMAGAPILAARAAAKSGAGRVFVAFADNPPAYDSAQAELMCRLAQEFDFSSATLVVGPGLGVSREAGDLLAKALNARVPLVLDADALNLIADEPGLQRKLAARPTASILTPHPLEAARLLATSSMAVQADRLAAARTLAYRFNAIVILKGSGSIIARPDSHAAINTTGNPALATAGTGDVLAGICGALLAQHWPAWEAALAAVWLHGSAADLLVQQGIGPIGMTAGELIPIVRILLNRLVAEYVPARGA